MVNVSPPEDIDASAGDASRVTSYLTRPPQGGNAPGLVGSMPWWQRAPMRHPASRFVLIFLPLAALWFVMKFFLQDQTASPLAPPATLSVPASPQNPQPVGETVAVPAKPKSLVFDDDLPGMDEHRRRDAILAKEEAWLAWYRRPPECEHAQTQEIQVACASHYAEQVRLFEQIYRAGELR